MQSVHITTNVVSSSPAQVGGGGEGVSWPWSCGSSYTTSVYHTDVVSSNLDQGEVCNIMW